MAEMDSAADLRRRWALMLAQQGMDASPVRHPLQAVARAFQGAMGGYFAGEAEREDKQNREFLTNLPGLPGSSTATSDASTTAAPTGAASSDPSYIQRQAQLLSNSPPADMAPMLQQTAQKYGVDPNYALRTAQLESAYNPAATNSNSSAKGLYQFTDGTWGQYGNGGNPLDAASSADAAMRLARDNATAFSQKFGRAPSNGELYLMHQQGAAGGSALLANPKANVVDALAPVYGGDREKAAAAVVNNGGSPLQTAGDFASRWTSRFDDGVLPRGAVPAQFAGGQNTRQPVQIPPQMADWIVRGLRSSDPQIRQQALTLYGQYAKPTEKFEPVTDNNGNMYAQRSTLSGELKSAPHPERPTYGVVGQDEFQQPVYGWTNAATASVSPVPRFQASQVPGAQPSGSAVPAPPPGVDPKLWREKATESLVGNTLPGSSQQAAELRKEIRSLPSYQNYAQAMPIYKNMLKTAGENSKASDLNLVYSLGKIFDPNSVVREGEMVMARNTAALPDWLLGTINALNGGAALTTETRQKILTEAHHRITSYGELFNNDANQYRGIAQRGRFNEQDIIPSFGDIASPPQLATPGAPSPADIQQELKRRGLK